MKIDLISDDDEHCIEIYLTQAEIKRLYNEEGVVIKTEKNLLKDKKNVHFYIGNWFDSE